MINKPLLLHQTPNGTPESSTVLLLWLPRASIRMGQGRHVPPIFMKGDVVLARIILSSNSNNCCLLYFYANIICSFTKIYSAFGGLCPPDPLGLHGPGPRWGTSVPQIPSLLLCPPIILWDRRPWKVHKWASLWRGLMFIKFLHDVAASSLLLVYLSRWQYSSSL